MHLQHHLFWPTDLLILVCSKSDNDMSTVSAQLWMLQQFTASGVSTLSAAVAADDEHFDCHDYNPFDMDRCVHHAS